MRTISDGKGHTLYTPLTDEQAASRCRQLLGNRFALELASKWDRRHKPLSEAQLYYLHKLALQGDEPAAADLAVIARLFTAAARHSRSPRIYLRLPANPAQPGGLQQALALALASGAINVTDGRPFGRNIWYGRIMLGGAFQRSRQCDPTVLYLLHRLDQDPVGVAREHGLASGTCCFCSGPLADERSQLVGYGRCAINFGLPWNEVDSRPATVSKPAGLFADPAVQVEYERLVGAGMPPTLAQERAFDQLIAQADRLDQDRADSAN